MGRLVTKPAIYNPQNYVQIFQKLKMLVSVINLLKKYSIEHTQDDESTVVVTISSILFRGWGFSSLDVVPAVFYTSIRMKQNSNTPQISKLF